MTKQSRNSAIVVALLAVALIIGIAVVMKLMSGPSKRTVTVDAGATTRRADPHVASATLGILDMSRQAALEADLPEDARKSALAAIDESYAKMCAALDDPGLSDDQRIARVRDLNHEYSRSLVESGNTAHINRRAGEIWFELDLLSRRRLLPLMFDKLGMTDAQHKSADAAFMEVSVILRNEPAGGMPNERSMKAMLIGRDKLHALLTPDQRTKFEQVLRDEQEKRQRSTLSFRPTTTRTVTTTPATQPAR